MHRDPCLRQLFLESLLQGRELKAGTNSCWPGVLRSPGRQPRAGFGTVCPRPLLATPPPRAGPSTSLCPLGSPRPRPTPPVSSSPMMRVLFLCPCPRLSFLYHSPVRDPLWRSLSIGTWPSVQPSLCLRGPVCPSVSLWPLAGRMFSTPRTPDLLTGGGFRREGRGGSPGGRWPTGPRRLPGTGLAPGASI